MVFRSKAPCAGNGRVLVKRGNAAAGHHRCARRVGLSTFMVCVAPLAKNRAIRCEGREHDCMDAGGRVTQEQLPRARKLCHER